MGHGLQRRHCLALAAAALVGPGFRAAETFAPDPVQRCGPAPTGRRAGRQAAARATFADAGLPAAGRRYAEGIPGATLVVIPDVGHVTMIEAPEAFVAAAKPFLLR